jgi:hypothetical protein
MGNCAMDTPRLLFDLEKGYSCSACSWVKDVHVEVSRQPQTAENLRKTAEREFSEHVKERHIRVV